MGQLSSKTAHEWQTLAADALLSRAEKIAAGIDDWADAELRTAFLSRVAAGEDPARGAIQRNVFRSGTARHRGDANAWPDSEGDCRMGTTRGKYP